MSRRRVISTTQEHQLATEVATLTCRDVAAKLEGMASAFVSTSILHVKLKEQAKKLKEAAQLLSLSVL